MSPSIFLTSFKHLICGKLLFFIRPFRSNPNPNPSIEAFTYALMKRNSGSSHPSVRVTLPMDTDSCSPAASQTKPGHRPLQALQPPVVYFSSSSPVFSARCSVRKLNCRGPPQPGSGHLATRGHRLALASQPCGRRCSHILSSWFWCVLALKL